MLGRLLGIVPGMRVKALNAPRARRETGGWLPHQARFMDSEEPVVSSGSDWGHKLRERRSHVYRLW